MSRGGRWRRALEAARTAFVVMLLVALAGGACLIAGALQENPATMPAAARAAPMRAPELASNGPLHGRHEWLARRLALPRNATLMELDLWALRERILADGQVLTATLTRKFPDRLLVAITERAPVARVMAEIVGQRQQLLVARDGVVFAGAGYEARLVDSLPWLGGVAISRRGEAFSPIAGMDVVSDLLATARLNADHLYRTWKIVALDRLQSDREIVVRTHEPHHVTIVFGAPGDYLPQIAKLDHIWEQKLVHLAGTGQRARIDLSLGRQVPVRIEDSAAAEADPQAVRLVRFSLSPAQQPRTQREL